MPSQLSAAQQARRFVAEQCQDWGLSEFCDDVVLPVSELVTNAVVHARTSVHLTLSLSGEFLEVAVRDGSTRAPIVRPVRLDLAADIDTLLARAQDEPHNLRDPVWHVGEAGSIAAGRGMLIVDAIADEWGVTQLATGKEVWFRVRTPPTHHTSPCPGRSLRGGRPGAR